MLILVLSLILSAILFFGINSIVIFTRVKGNSMSPNIKDKEIIIGGRDSKYRRGDVVVCCTGAYNKKKIFVKGKSTFIKRVIGLPGEEISIKNGYVYINGTKLEEDYLPPNTKTITLRSDLMKIPKGCVFVMGDNRACSIDSRSPSFGVIEERNIVATCFTKFGTESGAIK